MARESQRRGKDGTGKSPYWGMIRESKDEILNVRSELETRRGWLGSFVHATGGVLVSPAFFVALLLAHLGWLWLNVPALSFVRPFDPNPFPLLAMIASAEAPFISLLILMRQEYDRRIAELREETSLQVALHTERESSQMIAMLCRIERALGVAEEGEERERVELMAEPLDPRRLVRAMREELEEEGEAPA